MLYEVHVTYLVRTGRDPRGPITVKVACVFAVVADDAHQAQEMVRDSLHTTHRVDASTAVFGRINVHQDGIFRCPR